MTFIEDMWCCLGSSKCFYIQVYLIENLKRHSNHPCLILEKTNCSLTLYTSEDDGKFTIKKETAIESICDIIIDNIKDHAKYSNIRLNSNFMTMAKKEYTINTLDKMHEELRYAITHLLKSEDLKIIENNAKFGNGYML